MRNPKATLIIGGALLLAAACGPGVPPPSAPAPSPAASPSDLERAARADSVRAYYNQADVDFMRGMIHHHAQALVMAGMAPSHASSPEIKTLAARTINGQKDEIALMQRWLRDRDEPAPEVTGEGRVTMGDAPGHAAHGDHAAHADPAADPEQGAGMDHGRMAGMLTPEQLRRLEEARGEEWDRLFLRYMIQHHQGALTMVEDLFATHGAGQGDEIFRIASEIAAEQATEIDRMQRMLAERIFGSGP